MRVPGAGSSHGHVQPDLFTSPAPPRQRPAPAHRARGRGAASAAPRREDAGPAGPGRPVDGGGRRCVRLQADLPASSSSRPRGAL